MGGGGREDPPREEMTEREFMTPDFWSVAMRVVWTCSCWGWGLFGMGREGWEVGQETTQTYKHTQFSKKTVIMTSKNIGYATVNSLGRSLCLSSAHAIFQHTAAKLQDAM